MSSTVDILNTHGLKLKYASATNAGEYSGPCGYCAATSGDGGIDRLRVWPVEGRFWCRRCNQHGPIEQLLAKSTDMPVECARTLLNTVPFRGSQAREARKGVTKIPPLQWRERAADLIVECADALWQPENHPMLEHLMHRGLREDTILKHHHGAVTRTRYESREDWGLPPADNPATGRPKTIWIPQGILVPRFLDDEPVCLQVRVFDRHIDARYVYVAGSYPVVKLIPAEVPA